MKLRLFSFMILLWFGLCAGGCLETVSTSVRTAKLKRQTLENQKRDIESRIQNIDRTLPEIDAEIAKHEENVRKMKERLRTARQNGTKPDISGMQPIATAAGSRSAAFHSAPAWKKDLIDKLEHNQVWNAWDATRLANAAVEGNVNEMHLDVEINRSNRFIGLLRNFRRQQEAERGSARNELQNVDNELAQMTTTTVSGQETEGGNGGGY